jgi:hypothetical protein
MMARLFAVTVIVLVLTLLLSGALRPMPMVRILAGGPPSSEVPKGSADPVAKIQPIPTAKLAKNVTSPPLKMARRVATPEMPVAPPEPLASTKMPVHKVVAEVATPAIPKEADLRPAMSRAELIDKFGEPNATAEWSDLGTIHERLTYLNERTYTELLLRDGRLVWSYTEQH